MNNSIYKTIATYPQITNSTFTMKIRLFFTYIFCVLFIACRLTPKDHDSTSSISISQAISQDIDSLISELKKIQNEHVLPGFAVSIFTKDEIILEKGFGYSDVASKTPYTTESVQMIASITKTLIGVSLMKAAEDGQIKLDDDVNDILPFTVRNPNFPNTPITIRQLATHTSSITSTKNSDKGYRFESPLLEEEFPKAHHPFFKHLNITNKLSMSDYLEFKLSKGGRWYEKEVYSSHEPGSFYDYSNLGATLLAHCIALKTGQSFDDYSEELILDRLEMNSSTWHLDEVDNKNHVTYYNEILNEVPRYSIVSYPDGGLYSSVQDLTKYLQEMMKGFDGEGNLLSANSYKEMMSGHYKDEEITEGLCWDLSMGTDLIGHAGNDYGTATLAYFSPSSGIGRILFTNMSLEKEELSDAYYGIYNLLFEYDFSE